MELLRAGTPGYESVRRPAMARFHGVRPRAVARCAVGSDVAEALAYARDGGLPVAVRSGGHCFAGRSSTDGLVLDVSPMDAISVADGLVTVGAGVRLGALYDALDARGVTLPAGCGPTVGISGLTLGGGLGILGRTYGLTSDGLRAATVVLADGRTVHCGPEDEPDLFWALRGGGAPGVVTALTFGTVPAPPATAFHLTWPFAAAAEVVAAWQEWAPDAPDGVTASLVVSAAGDPAREPVVSLFGAALDPAPLDGVVARLGTPPTVRLRAAGSYRETKRRLSGLDVHDGPEPADWHLHSRSGFFRTSLPPAAVAALLDHLAAARSPGHARELDFNPWGGAYNRVDPAATAFAHRAERFLLKTSVTVSPAADPAPALGWLADAYELTRPHGTGGAYPNFPDPALPDEDHAYYGDNAVRLRRVRATYDPDGVFTRLGGRTV
jgi:FAD/FMN-containing dehydrogenase